MTTESRPPVLRRAGIITAVALAALLCGHLFAAYEMRHSSGDHDEMQYLHIGWLMSQGKQLYRDFVDDHSPFLFTIFASLVPEGGTASMPLLDLLSYIARARAVTAACGALGLATLGFLAYRATGSIFAPLVTVAFLAGSDWMWHHAFFSARNDPPALLLFWSGTLFLLASWRTERMRFGMAGVGIGLAFAAALWNPKMPLECLVLGAVYLWKLKGAFRHGARMVALAIVPALAIGGAALLWIVRAVPLRDYLFFTFRYNILLFDYIRNSFEPNPRAFVYCDPAFKGVLPLLVLIAAAAILFVPAIRRKVRELDLQMYGVVFALAIAALLDIRFIYNHPNLWPQYYLMWGVAAAVLYGMTAAALLRTIRNPRTQAFVQIAASVVAVAMVLLAYSLRAPAQTWRGPSLAQQNLRPNETVWLAPDVHPIAAHDASYYWVGFVELAPTSMRYTASNPDQSYLPVLGEQDLPPCRAERGLDPHVRFVSDKALYTLPVARQCLDRMIASGRAVRASIPGAWDLRPAPRGP